MHARDNYNYDGYTLRVEFPRGNGPYPSRFDGKSDRRGGPGGRGRGGANRTSHRVLISGFYTLYIIFLFKINYIL